MQRIVMEMIMQKKGLLLKWLCMIKDYHENDYACKRHFIKWLYIEKGCH